MNGVKEKEMSTSKFNKLISLIMAVLIVFTMMPSMAFAEGSESGNENAAAPVLKTLAVAVGGAEAKDATELALDSAFSADKVNYKTTKLDYVASKDERFVYVKATADGDVTVTAKCGNSEVATMDSAVDGWIRLAVKETGGFFWAPSVTYHGCLEPGQFNDVIVTVSSADGAKKEYKVTIPMEVDLSKSALSWKTDLAEAVYFRKNAEDAKLTVEAQYVNRPIEDKTEITYQWYSNTTEATTGGTAIDGATKATYAPSTAAYGTTYYYAVATCGDKNITSKAIEVTISDEEAPSQIVIKCDYPYSVNDTWASALEGKKYYAEKGDEMHIWAEDGNGEITPVSWSGFPAGSYNAKTGIYTVASTSNLWITAKSLLDESVSTEKVLQVSTYKFSTGEKNKSVTLSSDGQKTATGSFGGGVDGYNIWSYKAEDGIAECTSGQTEKARWIYFNLYRPGTIEATFTLDMGGEADPKLMDTATLTIKGVAVETEDGQRTKAYLETSTVQPNPTMKLKAYTMPKDAAVTWSSSDESVVTVDENGKVTAKGIGSAIVYANDGTYKGGIKIVVKSGDVAYFESLNFTTGYQGVKNTSWKAADFKPTTLEYTGIELTSYSCKLTFTADTLFDSDKYEAKAEFVDDEGVPQTVTIANGAATSIERLAFEKSVVTVRLIDKTDAAKQTVYTFEVTRPRDTTKTVANNGITMEASGRDLLNATQEGKAEGTMYVANADGSLAQYSGAHYSRKYYRAYAHNGLQAFALNVKANTIYVHMRYSIDDGETWTEMTQGSDSTRMIFFPERDAENPDTNPVVKVRIQMLDDKTYAANVAEEKDGFADAACDEYTVWVEQLPALNGSNEVKILTGETDKGDWYPELRDGIYSYSIASPEGEAAPVLTFTVPEGTKVKVGSADVTPDENGKYTLELTDTNKEVTLTSNDGAVSQSYFFKWLKKSAKALPDKVTDYLPINSQYTNTGMYGLTPERTLKEGSTVLSLGNFGGYITWYYENGLKDDPNNKYGVDFYVYGNAFKDTSTGTGLGSMEPGQVWVSENGENWYALAGSEHYEKTTLWDYTVTYKKNNDGTTSWTDNYGNSDNGTQVGTWPMASNYPLNTMLTKDTITLSGILLPCWDGSLTGNGTFASYSSGAKFGYVDVQVNSEFGKDANPYSENKDNELASSGFDLAWAVDAEGNPIDVSDKEFHYVKVVTASNLWAGAANEKSTEVETILRTTAQNESVGMTSAPEGVTISDGADDYVIKFEEGKQVYTADLGDMKYVSVKVNGADAEDNVYVNNQRLAVGEAAEGFKVTKENGDTLVRVIVQNGEKEPAIYLLKLTSEASESNDLVDGVKITVSGVNRPAETKDGITYTASVGYRMNSIGIVPMADPEAEILVNGEAEKESYQLADGENVFTITAKKGDITQEVKLVVNKEQAPESTGKIKVYLTVKGDTLHGQSDKSHTLANGGLTTWLIKSYTVDAPITVVEIMEMAVKEKGWSYSNPGGNYIAELNGLAEFDNGNLSGWMYTLNGKHPNLGVAEQFLSDGDAIVFHYTDDYTKEEGSEAFGGLPFGATEPTVTMVDENDDALKDAAKYTFDAATGTLTITANEGFELKDVKVNGVSKGAAGTLTGLTAADSVVLVFAKSEQPASLSEAEVKDLVKTITPALRSVKTAKKNIKVTVRLNSAEKEAVKQLTDAGYTVKYNFYRSTKKSSGYKSMLVKDSGVYTNTKGVKNQMYYYKVRLQVYDEDGKLIARTALTDCRYANRKWTK